MWLCLECMVEQKETVCVGCTGFKSGFGSRWNLDGSSFSGEWLNGVPHGKGCGINFKGDVYQGDWCCGKRKGSGTSVAENGDKYVGQWDNDLPNGKGTLFMPIHCAKFKGTFVDGMLHGLAAMRLSDEDSEESGFWVNGKREGLFILDRRTDSTSWLSNWKDGKIVRNWELVREHKMYHLPTIDDMTSSTNHELSAAMLGIASLVGMKT